MPTFLTVLFVAKCSCTYLQTPLIYLQIKGSILDVQEQLQSGSNSKGLEKMLFFPLNSSDYKDSLDTDL